MSLPIIAPGGAGSRLEDIGLSFAYDLARRIAQAEGLDAAGRADLSAADSAQFSGQEASQDEKLTRLEKLEKALSGTVSYMAEKHGEKAAKVLIGLVYKRLGDGGINEQTLGNAFLDVTRFLDANFGFSAGDAFMAHLNGGLNETMNAFFDNGLNEVFMATPSSGGGGVVGVEGLLSEISAQYAHAVKTLLEEARDRAGNGPAAAYAHTERQKPLLGIMMDMAL